MSYLDKIVAARRNDVRNEKRFVPVETFFGMVAQRRRRSFAAALRSQAPAIIAEFKRASPSAGAIDHHCDAGAIAAAFERGGAAALSVLTERRHFRGSFADLCRARAATKLPVLCKDFIVDDFQIWKATAFGADAVLLMAAALDDHRLRELLALTSRLGVDAVVEVHTEAEAARALDAGSRIIGINNRDLQTFAVDTTTATRLRSHIPRGCLVIAESGYIGAEQIRAGVDAGIPAYLVGEAVMRAADRSGALRDLRQLREVPA